MVASTLSKMLGAIAVMCGLILMMFNDLGKLEWTIAGVILIGGGGWLVTRRPQRDDDWPA